MRKTRICHLTSAHSETDIRIFIKECSSLSNMNYEVNYVVPGVEDNIRNNIFIHGIKKEKKNRLVRMTNTTNLVYKKALEIDADIYHFHDPELIPIGLKLKKRKKIVIYDIHEDLPRAILSKKWINPSMRKIVSILFELYEDWACKKFDCLFTATPFITERFKRHNDNTVNLNNYPILAELEKPYSANKQDINKVASYVGGLGSIRGAHQLIDAADLIKGTLRVAGSISPDETKQRFISHKNVEYLGNINRVEVKELLSNSLVGIVTFLPEPNHINAQPNKMFEYMSASLPVICSNFSSWKTIIEKHECGICVDPLDSKAIADAINYVFENPDIAKKMGENGRVAVVEEYNWEMESQKLLNVYKNLSK